MVCYLVVREAVRESVCKERDLDLSVETGIPYTMSKSGRPVIFTRDPDGNALECQPSYMHETPKN